MTDFHAYTSRGVALIYSDEEPMPKYDKIDAAAAVATKRRDDIVSGRALVPAGACHYCGFNIGRGQLWCSTACAMDYDAERKKINAAE